MAQRVKMPKIDPGVVVDITDYSVDPGAEYHFSMKPVTLDVEEELEEAQKEVVQVESNPDASPVDRMEVQLKQLDIILEPQARPGGDSFDEKTPTELLLPGYKEKKVTATQIRSLVSQIVERSRPI